MISKKIITQDELNNSKECMRSSAFVTMMNGKEYLRVTETMSNGYFFGTLLSFAKNYCASATDTKSTFLKTLNAPATKESDSLSRLPADSKPLQHNYAIMFALGMIETDGKFNDGRDAGAWNIDAQSAEAGTYQASFDSHLYTNPITGKEKITYVSQVIYDSLMKKYSNGNSPLCMKEIFSINQTISTNIETWGWGAGANFQEALKKCPALSADYQAYLLRQTYEHNGPVKRKHAQPRMECIQVMNKVAEHLSKNDNCSALSNFTENFNSYTEFANFKFNADTLSPRPLVRGPNSWNKDSDNKGWSYEPLVLNKYWLSDKYIAPDGSIKNRPEAEQRKSYPRYNEIPWIKNTIRYWEKVALNSIDDRDNAKAQIARLQSEITNILTEKKDDKLIHLGPALEKHKNDLEYADVAISKLRKDLKKLDLSLYSLEKPQSFAKLSEIQKAKVQALLKFIRQRESFVLSKNKILKDFSVPIQ